ncbi:MAG: SDR family oxidoreductase [Candidatus Magnetoovum sp. WYHC-5]|nr:SDR family oxidoreductase [Candidatus Magnetoovum sp. WYHC-5]
MSVAFIAGGSGGLGREVVLALLKEGMQVMTTYNNSNPDVSFSGYDWGLNIQKMDLTNVEEIEQAFKTLHRLYGRLDVLINCAALNMDGLLVKYKEDDWDTCISVNLTANFHLVKHAVPLLERSGGGHVVLVSSISGLKGKAGQPAYSASKGALIGFTLSLAKELACHNIRVNAILPGYMATQMGFRNQSAILAARKASLLHTLSTVSEAAEFIRFLISTKNLTGQVFTLDNRIF